MNSVSLIINKILDLQNWNSCQVGPFSLHQTEQNEIRVANSVVVILHAAFASISNINAHVHACSSVKLPKFNSILIVG